MAKSKKSIRVRPRELSVTASGNSKPASYESDYFGWTLSQINLLKTHQYNKLDIKNLILEMESLGNSELRALESYFAILFLHLLKIQYQPTMHTKSWDLSIENAQYHIKRLLERNPGLKKKLPEVLKDAYFTARLHAASETGLEKKTFPEECPWTLEEALTSEEDEGS